MTAWNGATGAFRGQNLGLGVRLAHSEVWTPRKVGDCTWVKCPGNSDLSSHKFWGYPDHHTRDVNSGPPLACLLAVSCCLLARNGCPLGTLLNRGKPNCQHSSGTISLNLNLSQPKRGPRPPSSRSLRPAAQPVQWAWSADSQCSGKAPQSSRLRVHQVSLRAPCLV